MEIVFKGVRNSNGHTPVLKVNTETKVFDEGMTGEVSWSVNNYLAIEVKSIKATKSELIDNGFRSLGEN